MCSYIQTKTGCTCIATCVLINFKFLTALLFTCTRQDSQVAMQIKITPDVK